MKIIDRFKIYNFLSFSRLFFLPTLQENKKKSPIWDSQTYLTCIGLSRLVKTKPDIRESLHLNIITHAISISSIIDTPHWEPDTQTFDIVEFDDNKDVTEETENKSSKFQNIIKIDKYDEEMSKVVQLCRICYPNCNLKSWSR